MADSVSFVTKHFHVLKKMKHLPYVKRTYLFMTGGPDLIYAVCELMYNLISHSSKKNLDDRRTIKIIKDNYVDIGLLISKASALKDKRRVISQNKQIQYLALNVALDGYEFIKSATGKE